MPIIIRQLGIEPYAKTWQAMRDFTQNRTSKQANEIWLVQHPAVYTQGRADKTEYLLRSTNIPVVQSDRGGQITYHGEGQQIMYVLFDLRQLNLDIKTLITQLEQSVVNLLAEYRLSAKANPKAHGVYINGKKICSLGLKVSRGCTLHGLALNVNMDLTPFNHINPCGHVGLEMCQLADFVPNIQCSDIALSWVEHLKQLIKS